VDGFAVHAFKNVRMVNVMVLMMSLERVDGVPVHPTILIG